MKIFIGVIIILILLAMGVWFLNSPIVQAPTENTNIPSVPQNNTPQPTSEPEVVTVEMIPSGFSPSQLTIKAGTKVRFINKDSVTRWPASGAHPTHLICSGFDAKEGIAPGESYEFTFQEAKTCPMHDHLNSSLKGSIKAE